MHAVVIGGGISGLAAALRLRAAGREVTLLEAGPRLGGKIHTVEQDGFVFDAGPSFLTQPERLDELFALFGERRADHLPIQRVDPSVHYTWNDGTRVSTPQNREALVAQLATLGATPSQINAYLDEIARQYEVMGAPFVQADAMRAGFWLGPTTLGGLKHSLGMLGRTFHAYNESWFPHSPRLVQLLCRYSTYAGSDPFQAPSMLNSIADVELRQGIYYATDGMNAVGRALTDLLARQGVHVRLNAEVTGLTAGANRIHTVELGEERLLADQVVSAIDPQFLAPMLGRPLADTPRALSALILFLGVETTTPVGLHNILFSDDYRTEFAALSRGEVPDDPTIYLNHTSCMDPDHAPPGMQNWFVMINASADRGQDWGALQQRMRARVLPKLERHLGSFTIHTEGAYTPLDIARTSRAWQGSIYGPASNGLRALFRKQRATDPQLGNLFYCGGSCHPGGGIPMCLASAKIATDYAISASS